MAGGMFFHASSSLLDANALGRHCQGGLKSERFFLWFRVEEVIEETVQTGEVSGVGPDCGGRQEGTRAPAGLDLTGGSFIGA